MLKLVKYEFRKAAPSLLTLLGLTVLMELGFLYLLYKDNETGMLLMLLPLGLCAFVSALFVFIHGITAYSGELKSRSRDLIFMTPNSTLKIVGSKFLYTFFNALLFTAVFVALTVLDYGLLLKYFGEYEDFVSGVRGMLVMSGIPVTQALYAILFMLTHAYLSLLAVVAIAWLSITLCNTLLRDRKWQWLPALALFLLLNWGFSELCGLLPSSADQMILLEESFTNQTHLTVTGYHSLQAMMLSLLPTAGLSAGVVLLSLFGCARLLKTF